jgi:hypothetical protein
MIPLINDLRCAVVRTKNSTERRTVRRIKVKIN